MTPNFFLGRFPFPNQRNPDPAAKTVRLRETASAAGSRKPAGSAQNPNMSNVGNGTAEGGVPAVGNALPAGRKT